MFTKVFSILLSGLILFQSLGVTAEDMPQLDELIEHAQYHAEQHGDNLLVFISKHYGDLKEQHSDDHQEENKDHEELPFQNYSPQSPTPALMTSQSIVTLFDNIIPDIRTNFFGYTSLTSTPHTRGLLQPPKQA